MNKHIMILIVVVGVAVLLGFWFAPANFKQEPQPEPVVVGECFIGGCSSQICSDQKDVVSTCEYREEYACYQTATCERQTSGECGWTETSELLECLVSAKTETEGEIFE